MSHIQPDTSICYVICHQVVTAPGVFTAAGEEFAAVYFDLNQVAQLDDGAIAGLLTLARRGQRVYVRVKSGCQPWSSLSRKRLISKQDSDGFYEFLQYRNTSVP